MNYLDNNDYELIYLVRERNDEATTILYKKYEKLVKKIATYYYEINKKKKIEYDDLFQEGMIGLSQAINDYKLDKNVLFFTFALLCIKAHIIDYLNKTQRQKSLILFEASSLEKQSVERCINYEDPLALVEQKALEEVIINFKNTLDFLDANIFELRYNYFSYKQIASLLDVNIKVVDNRLLKIKRKLKKYLLELK